MSAIKFRYVLMDSWFASKESFEFILEKDKHFIAVLKANRLVALTEQDKKEGRFVRISQLELADQQAVRGWLKGFPQEVLLVRRVFTNKDGGLGEVTNPHSHYSEQPCLHVDLCGIQAGMFKNKTQGQSFCTTNQAIHQG